MTEFLENYKIPITLSLKYYHLRTKYIIYFVTLSKVPFLFVLHIHIFEQQSSLHKNK